MDRRGESQEYFNDSLGGGYCSIHVHDEELIHRGYSEQALWLILFCSQ